MARSDLLALVPAGLASACTFTGLGSYDVPACKNVVGSIANTNSVGDVSGTPQLSYTPGLGAVAAFVDPSNDVQLADGSGNPVGMGTAIFGGNLSPVQPFAVPLGTGYVAVAVATTSPCTTGRVNVGTFAESTVGTPYPDPSACTKAALPSVAATADAIHAWVAWYETDQGTMTYDPVGDCTMATPGPLKLALASKVAGQSPTLAAPVQLSGQATSVRPPAMTLAGSDVLLASPDGMGVSVWDISGISNPGSGLSVPGLAGARAVSIATDGGENIAVVAEIGCAPQAIALALGTLSSGLTNVVTVAAAGTALQVSPTVVWASAQGYWNVSWLSNAGGTHVLAQRYDTKGVAVGGVIDPHASVLAATLASDGTLFGYVDPTTGSAAFEDIGLGCALGPGGNEAEQE